jgi:hypothetical protein
LKHWNSKNVENEYNIDLREVERGTLINLNSEAYKNGDSTKSSP